MTKTFKPLMLAFLASMAVQGCRCDRNNTGNSKGEIRVIYDEGGVRVSGDNGVYDFGQVSMGKVEHQKVIIQNTGLGTLSITGFEKQSGDNVLVGTAIVESNPVFELKFDQQIDLPSSETVELDLAFMPPVNPTLKQVDHQSILTLKAANTEPGRETAQITLKGKAVSGECDLPAVIDFGAVARGDTYNVSQPFKNTRPIDTLAFVSDIESQQGAGIFTFTPDSPRGEFVIGANKEKTVTITFTPTEARDYFATVTMRAADGCPDKRVRLIGTGVDQVLSWSPATVDFGYVTPGLNVTGEVTFSNQGLKAVELTGMNTFEGSSPSAVFKVTMAGGDLTKLTVPAATRDPMSMALVPGTAKVTMTFKPIVLGPRSGTLRANADLRTQSTVVVPLRGVGGGPDIDLRPSPTLNFGRIAYFIGANPPSFANRKLTVQNVGTRPTPPDPKANLKLGKTDGAGGFAKPYWTVTPKNMASSADEICLGTFDSMTNTCLNDLPATGPGKYDPNIGLEASGTNAILDIPVRITPNGLGMKEWEVTIFSNDPDEPEVKITVQANSVMLPPCNATVTPLNLNFGVISPPLTKDLGFQIRNNGTQASEVCLITNVQLQPETGTPAGMPPVFSLPAGDVNEKELQPGETMQVLVRAWPQGQLPPTPATVSGRVQFNVSNPMAPQGNVTLTATIAPSCLAISPSSLDFGTVQKDCNSPDRSFQIYNTCTQAVTINQTQMIAAAGEPPGGPNCPGTAPCPEFFVVQNITAGTVINPGGATPINFALKYRPINYGPDSGAFLIKVTQSGQQVDYVVTLRGQGDTMGLNTDTFRQDSKPKADILVVVDDSCSMSEEQQRFDANFNSFVKYAVSAQIDFQIGITTTDPGTSVKGRLKASPAGVKLFKPTTPNLEQQFGATIQVGINGSATETCLEPAVAALTAPLITDPAANAGLLRQDAVLAVVCVTDATDQSTQPASFYFNQLANIKGAQRPGMFSYNVVGPFLQNPGSIPGCSYDGNGDDGKHAYMVAQTNGVKEEICATDWARALENIGKNAFGFRTNFFLTARPDLTSMRGIEVGIDSIPCTSTTQCGSNQVCSMTSGHCVLPPTDSRGAKVWEYDATNNSINFEPLYVPEPGKTLTVTYQVACIP